MWGFGAIGVALLVILAAFALDEAWRQIGIASRERKND
jgi:hypothetical protein